MSHKNNKQLEFFDAIKSLDLIAEREANMIGRLLELRKLKMAIYAGSNFDLKANGSIIVGIYKREWQSLKFHTIVAVIREKLFFNIKTNVGGSEINYREIDNMLGDTLRAMGKKYPIIGVITLGNRLIPDNRSESFGAYLGAIDILLRGSTVSYPGRQKFSISGICELKDSGIIKLGSSRRSIMGKSKKLKYASPFLHHAFFANDKLLVWNNKKFVLNIKTEVELLSDLDYTNASVESVRQKVSRLAERYWGKTGKFNRLPSSNDESFVGLSAKVQKAIDEYGVGSAA